MTELIRWSDRKPQRSMSGGSYKIWIRPKGWDHSFLTELLADEWRSGLVNTNPIKVRDCELYKEETDKLLEIEYWSPLIQPSLPRC